MSPIDEGPSLEQMRAFLMRQGVFPQNAAFDDGASLLGQNSDMQQVGFKIPKISKVLDIPHNPGRRNMGLTLPKQDNQSVVGPQSQFAQTLTKEREAAKAPAVPQAPTVSPLEFAAEAIKNMPMTRRQVLQTPLNAAVSHYGRNIIGDLPTESSFTNNPTIDQALKDRTLDFYTSDMNSETPVSYATALYSYMRKRLAGAIPESELSIYDKINKEFKSKLKDEEFEESQYDLPQNYQTNLQQLDQFIKNNIDKLKPHEQVEAVNKLRFETHTHDEIYDDLMSEYMKDSSDILADPKDLAKYLIESKSNNKALK
jgi:hypothetical protein